MMSRISIVVSSAVVSSKSASAMSFLWLEVQACIFSPVFFFCFFEVGGRGGVIVIVFPFFLILHGTVRCSSDQCVLNISSLRP